MKCLCFPGRPGYRLHRLGNSYNDYCTAGARHTTDQSLLVITSIHRGLKQLRIHFGHSFEEVGLNLHYYFYFLQKSSVGCSGSCRSICGN